MLLGPAGPLGVLPTSSAVAMGGEMDDLGEAALLLRAVDGRVVVLHPLGRVATDAPRHDAFDLRRAGEVLERPTEAALGEALAQADQLGDVGERLVEDRRRPVFPVTPGNRRSHSCISGVSSWVSTCQRTTCVNRGHALLSKAVHTKDVHTVDPAWRVDDHHGHGTEMAGIALYGDLREALSSTAPVSLRHRVESVKVLPRQGSNHPELYGAITAAAVGRAEIHAPDRRRAIAMAVATTEFRDRGQPSAWSAEVDKLCAGVDDGERRLFVLTAGNAGPGRWPELPGSQPDRGDSRPWAVVERGDSGRPHPPSRDRRLVVRRVE
jgi:hypothetical protein